MLNVFSQMDHLGDVMVSLLASSAVGCGFEPRPGQTKDLKIDIAASQLGTQHLGVRAKTGWPRVKIMRLGKLACLAANCRFCDLAR